MSGLHAYRMTKGLRPMRALAMAACLAAAAMLGLSAPAKAATKSGVRRGAERPSAAVCCHAVLPDAVGSAAGAPAVLGASRPGNSGAPSNATVGMRGSNAVRGEADEPTAAALATPPAAKLFGTGGGLAARPLMRSSERRERAGANGSSAAANSPML